MKSVKHTFYLPVKDFFEVIYLKDSCQGPHDSRVLSCLPMACFTAALLEVFHGPPSMTSLTMPVRAKANGVDLQPGPAAEM